MSKYPEMSPSPNAHLIQDAADGQYEMTDEEYQQHQYMMQYANQQQENEENEMRESQEQLDAGAYVNDLVEKASKVGSEGGFDEEEEEYGEE